MLKMRLELLGDFEVLADRQPISTPSARHPLLEVKADCQRRGRAFEEDGRAEPVRARRGHERALEHGTRGDGWHGCLEMSTVKCIHLIDQIEFFELPKISRSQFPLALTLALTG